MQAGKLCKLAKQEHPNELTAYRSGATALLAGKDNLGWPKN
jgi:hypothetical protein